MKIVQAIFFILSSSADSTAAFKSDSDVKTLTPQKSLPKNLNHFIALKFEGNIYRKTNFHNEPRENRRWVIGHRIDTTLFKTRKSEHQCQIKILPQ